MRSITRTRQGMSMSLRGGPATASLLRVPIIAPVSSRLQHRGGGTKGLGDGQWGGRVRGSTGKDTEWYFYSGFTNILKDLHKPRKYLLVLCSSSTGELWILHPGSHKIMTGPQQCCSHTPATGWRGQKLLPKQNPLFLMPEQSLHTHESCQRAP